MNTTPDITTDTTSSTGPSYITDKRALLIRLHKIEGQVRGLERMVDTILAESTFGRGAKGIEQAALAWYGRPLDDLVPEERLLLITLMKGPSHYDPVCRPERFAQRYPWAAKRAGFADAGSALRAALARMRPSACPRN